MENVDKIEIFDIDINSLEELIIRSTNDLIDILLCQKILKEINVCDNKEEKVITKKIGN